MIDIRTRRAAFSQRLLNEAEARMSARLGLFVPAPRVVDVPVVMGAKGTALVVGSHVFFRLGLNGVATVQTWSLAATIAGAASAGNITLDVQVGTTVGGVASICGTNKPQLTAQSERADQLPTSWTAVQIADPRWVLVTVTATGGTLEVVSLTLRLAVDQR